MLNTYINFLFKRQGKIIKSFGPIMQESMNFYGIKCYLYILYLYVDIVFYD